MQTPTYDEVFDLAQQLKPDDQVQLLQALSQIIYQPVAVIESDELISSEEIAESEIALQDYFAGRDRGISSKELKQQLSGEHLG
jgi:hypothetical protein